MAVAVSDRMAAGHFRSLYLTYKLDKTPHAPPNLGAGDFASRQPNFFPKFH
jgi:hypothetical protein